MRVKCRSDKDSFSIEYNNITVGKIYDVIGLSKEYSMGTDMYTIKDDNGFNFTHGISIFTLIEEDKMDQVRIIRKLEDLDGLENGNGLKISVYGHPLMIKTHIPFEDNIIFSKMVKDCRIETIHQLKAMGFKFEYKPLRSLGEVIEEMRLKSLDRFGSYEYKLFSVGSINKNSSYLPVEANGHFVGEYLFSEETAQKYADELNEILGGR